MNIILLGPPGVGKGTQAKRIVDSFGCLYISTGDLLREIMKRSDSFAQSIVDIVKSGHMVDDQTVFSLIEDKLYSINGDQNILFDGFPRNFEQAVMLEKYLLKNNKHVDLVINFVLDDSILEKRVSGRYICSDCGAVYNRFFLEPKISGICDSCGSVDFVTRSDDTVETVRRRLSIYHATHRNIIEFYYKKKILFEIDANKDVDLITEEVFSRIKNSVSQLQAVKS